MVARLNPHFYYPSILYFLEQETEVLGQETQVLEQELQVL
jgi:hypothetical protein